MLEYLTVQQPMGKLKSKLNNVNSHLLLINVDFLKKHTVALCPIIRGTGTKYLLTKFLITKILITKFRITKFLSNKVHNALNS